MTQTVYESPDDTPEPIVIDATTDWVWFFGSHRGVKSVRVAMAELPAIHRALGEFIDLMGLPPAAG